MSTPIGRTGLSRVTPAAMSTLAVVGSMAVAAVFDDFLGDVIADQWNYTEGTDGATADAAILAGGPGGVLRMTTGDAGTGLAADLCMITTALQWRASNGGLSATAKFKLSQITDAYLFFGFTDVVTLEAPIEASGTGNALVSNASNAVGFLFDTRMTDDKFWLVGVKADVDAVAQNTAVAPVAATDVTLSVLVSTDGTASFYINDVGVGSAMVNAVTAATMLTPAFAASKTATATSMTADVDFVGVSMDR